MQTDSTERTYDTFSSHYPAETVTYHTYDTEDICVASPNAMLHAEMDVVLTP